MKAIQMCFVHCGDQCDCGAPDPSKAGYDSALDRAKAAEKALIEQLYSYKQYEWGATIQMQATYKEAQELMNARYGKMLSRIDIIGQNGNDGLHYKAIKMNEDEDTKGSDTLVTRLADDYKITVDKHSTYQPYTLWHGVNELDYYQTYNQAYAAYQTMNYPQKREIDWQNVGFVFIIVLILAFFLAGCTPPKYPHDYGRGDCVVLMVSNISGMVIETARDDRLYVRFGATKPIYVHEFEVRECQ